GIDTVAPTAPRDPLRRHSTNAVNYSIQRIGRSMAVRETSGGSQRFIYLQAPSKFRSYCPIITDKAMASNPGFTNPTGFHKHFPDEDSCREYLERIRWKGTITCPHCKTTTIYRVD